LRAGEERITLIAIIATCRLFSLAKAYEKNRHSNVGVAIGYLTGGTAMSIEAFSIARSALGSSRITGNSTAEWGNPWSRSSKTRILICEAPEVTESLLSALNSTGFDARASTLSHPISPLLRNFLPEVDVVLLDLTTKTNEVLPVIGELSSAIGVCRARPRLLSFSTVHRNPRFVLDAEKHGARYVRVENIPMLVEAIELFAAETNELERDGPFFQILHRYSQGTCAPGEEVSAVLLADHGEFRQLPLAVVERLLFDFLAQHRRIAMDSLQIVSGLNGGWFYREHAANSGHKQIKRLRRATVKVIIQRIRDSMTSTFGVAHLGFDSRNVLRSCLAEGTNRVLYRLDADVKWHHELS
jgi:hypothetical protein